MISVVIPVFNEQKSIPLVLSDIKRVMSTCGHDYEIIFVDDCSTDESVKILRESQVKLICHKLNQGTGQARTTGVLAAKGEWVLMMDADSSYCADDIPEMLKYMDGYSMVVGARTTEYGNLKYLRLAVKFIFRKIASLLSGADIRDLNSGLRLIKKAQILKFISFLPATHSWVTSITMLMLYNNLKVKYISVRYLKRVGKSSFRPFRDSLNILRAIARTTWHFKPLKLVIAGFFLLLFFVFLFILGLNR